jgi:1-acyl-sn-glycerol-3-phosphate acyltransferase
VSLPPPALRRLVTIPAVFLLTIGVFAGVPVLLIVLALVSPWIPGRWRPLRLFAFLLVYLVAECVGLLIALWLWIASGCGRRLHDERFQRAHYRLLTRMLVVLYQEAVRLFQLRIEVESPPPESYDRGGDAPRRPLLVLCRHAGPGDSFLLMYALLALYGRQPRVVLKETLAVDPGIDVVLNRLPACFVRSRPASGRSMPEAIGDLAATMGPDDTLVIFPEGGNFTLKRRRQAIAKLRRRGLHRRAEQAERMRHVLPPYTTGVLAAMEAAPQADVVLVVHAGLDGMSSVIDLWHGLPMDQVVQVRWWRVRAEDLPTSPEERASWLFAQWFQLDAWLQERRDNGEDASREESAGHQDQRF